MTLSREDLRCPKCSGEFAPDSLRCERCGSLFEECGGRFIFLQSDELKRFGDESIRDAENAFKNYFKRWPIFYTYFSRAISPVLFTGMTAKRFINTFGPFPNALNVGSGSTRLQEPIVNVDVFPFRGVDIIANAEHLPFRDNIFDAVCAEEVLEHVGDADVVIKEMVRVAKPGGYIYFGVPFIFPFHPSPSDLRRWTIEDVRRGIPGCELVNVGVLMGPTSGMLSVLAVWLATIFSFGISPLRKFLKYPFLVILSPLKFIDSIYARLPGGEDVAAAFYAVYRKIGTSV